MTENQLYMILLMKAIKKIFCFHQWKLMATTKYNVFFTKSNQPEGEVTIKEYKCIKCEKDKIVPTNRIHYKQLLNQ